MPTKIFTCVETSMQSCVALRHVLLLVLLVLVLVPDGIHVSLFLQMAMLMRTGRDADMRMGEVGKRVSIQRNKGWAGVGRREATAKPPSQGRGGNGCVPGLGLVKGGGGGREGW